MHRYLRAIGFSELSDKDELKKILEDSVEHNDEEDLIQYGKGPSYGELRREYADGIGICSRGEVKKEYFEFEYYYPYFEGTGITTREEIYVERQAEKESYLGACDDNRVGVTIIFYLQNMIEYLKEAGSKDKRGKTSLTLSALSVDGRILLSVSKDKEKSRHDKEEYRNRSRLIEKAKRGDEEAMESLTLSDMDLYSRISRRIMDEDVFSIVDTYFMPYGMECDKYSVMGEILTLEERKNSCTGEVLYIMGINCNEMIFDVCINKKDLLGEPLPGRRFKGTVWLQGKINFEKA